MIPAKSSCPSSWTKQYAEFLTFCGSYPDHYGAKYLCLDENPEYMTDVARQHEENGRLFYPVHAVCGFSSLPAIPEFSNHSMCGLYQNKAQLCDLKKKLCLLHFSHSGFLY